MTSRLVVVGNGMAGSRLVQEVRRRDRRGQWQITVIGAEPHGAYNRVLLSNVLAGTASPASIRMSLPTTDGPTIDVLTGATVTCIDRANRQVVTDDDRRIDYDVLVLATGSRALVPPIPGLHSPSGELVDGAAVFRTLDDCERILRLTESARHAVVLGGGLLGLEAARGLVGRGLTVDLVHRASFLMERQLDDGAGAVLARVMNGLGMRVFVDAVATEVRCTADGRVTHVALDDGTELATDLLVVACGVAPETALARAAGLAVDTGVLVDDLMTTSDPSIRAIGECAQHDGRTYGLVAPAWEQADVVAEVLTGDDSAARYAGSRLVTRLKAAGVELAAMGDIDPSCVEEDDEVLQFVDAARGTYKKLIIRSGRIAGAILLGDMGTVGAVTQLFDRAAVVPNDRLTLLFAGLAHTDAVDTPGRLPDRATVCRCNGVTKGAITTCWLDGGRDLAAIAERTRATTGCGTCRSTVEGIVDWMAATTAEERGVCA